MKLKPKKSIGITLGDPSGIGPEVVAKALSNPSIRNLAHFVIIGDYEVYAKYSLSNYKNCSFLDCKSISLKNLKIGKENALSGKASLAYLNKAIELLKEKKISSLATAPVSKEAISLHMKSLFKGHTEFLADAFNVKKVGMMFVADNIRLIIATRHIPLNKVCSSLNREDLYETIRLTHQGLENLFKIKKPTIAVCGLNPHAGEGGKIGREEIDVIVPAIKKANKDKMNVEGPFAADTIFTPETRNKYDVIIAMYHDQGLVGVKTLCFKELVNLTIGLPFIRTSTAHGTAFNIAGKNQADPSSMCEAIKLAAELTF